MLQGKKRSTNKIIVVAECILALLLLVQVKATVNSATTMRNVGSVFIPEKAYVKPFGFRIADMMADLLLPDFDNKWYAYYWENAFNDLVAASPNKEINYVQMRIWWRVNTGEGTNASDWINPQLGSNDSTQGLIMQNDTWKRWYLGYIANGTTALPYGPSAIERIHQAGLKFEFCLSGAWENGDVVKPPMFGWGANESDYQDWMALGGGDKFLDNYLNNVLLPVANFAKDYLQSGDIFMLSFEMVYPTATFTWSHNPKWKYIINSVRDVFRAAGKSIILTIDHCAWYDDFGLGYDAVKTLDPTAPITTNEQGVSGASYLGDLDFVSFSWWLPVILPNEVPANWSSANIANVTNSWFNNKNLNRVGTGYRAVATVPGRDMIADLRIFSLTIGKKVLMNTGWVNRHGWLAWDKSIPITADNEEQWVAWSAQLGAIGDIRSNFTVWCAGQDFERYVRDKAAEPSYRDTSWRKAPAETAIIAGIQSILSKT